MKAVQMNHVWLDTYKLKSKILGNGLFAFIDNLQKFPQLSKEN